MAAPRESLQDETSEANIRAVPISTITAEPSASSLTDTSSLFAFICPICEESMITLAQLNQHIDDVHDQNSLCFYSQDTNFTKGKLAHVSRSPPQKRILKLDLHESSSRFSLSLNGDSSKFEDSIKLTKHHWKQMPSSRTNNCTEKGCKNILNTINGEVNCRKCGNLFCSQHTKNRAYLSNGPLDFTNKEPLPIFDSINGISVKICPRCHMEKHSIKTTEIMFKDITKIFVSERQKMLQQKDLARSIVRSRFIKLADLHSQRYLWDSKNSSSLLPWSAISLRKFSKGSVFEKEREIVGDGRWEADIDVTHCKLCYTKFSLLIRKHHCRLCGVIVNDGSSTSDNPANFCSAQVPMSLLLEKMPQLNYSPLVHDSWDILLAADKNSSYSVRICKTCKDLLFHTNIIRTITDSKEHTDVLDTYDQILGIKTTIISSMKRYTEIVHENNEKNNYQTNRLRFRLRRAIKDLEIMVNLFFNRHFALDIQSKKMVPLHSTRLVTNIYKGITAFLQESILELKRINEEFQSSENTKLAAQLGIAASLDGTPQFSISASLSPSSNPRLTKKEIRELREQLMVTNEQKFIVENLMENLKRQRKFAELATLEENKLELASKIIELTEELGEFGF